MDVFELRQHLVQDYRRFVTSFLALQDKRIRERVESNLDEGRLWPDPMVGLNPGFEPGGWIDELVADGTLHPDCAPVFRKDKRPDAPLGEPMRLHHHQVEAIRTARAERNFVLTTGTGSGKSLAYMVPIVDHALRNGSGRGVQAIVVYPMNALANSQENELTKFLCAPGSSDRPAVTFRRYTGQEREEQRQAILDDPPDIILTNYVMLELILTRVRDRKLLRAAEGLRFLVLDELHTYRGRQGADVALLVRRVREACRASDLQCIGTSATLAGGATVEEDQRQVARVASLIFGAEVWPGDVIGETLRRTTPTADLESPGFVATLTDRIASGAAAEAEYAAFVADPLSVWIERTLGVEDRDGRLVRVAPTPIDGPAGAAVRLERLTGVPFERCSAAIRAQLLAGYRARHPETGFPAFAFRLHQFVGKGDTVYASLEPEDVRFLTLDYQRFAPGNRDRALFPLAFCRQCGQEYYVVRQNHGSEAEVVDDEGQTERPHFTKRDLGDRVSGPDSRAGFLYLSTINPWDDTMPEERLPEDWLEIHQGAVRVKSSMRPLLPREITVDGRGQVNASGRDMWFVPAPFRFCLACGVAYAGQFQSDFGKLATLGSEGRSTATTVLSLAAVRYLRSDTSLEPHARKLLTFTDNRQDASLQAGHFNDFVQVGLLRAAILRAVDKAGERGLRHDQLTDAVFRALDLPFEYYATNPELRYAARADTERTMRDVLGYRLYRDLERGWRITAPNLEQCGLLRIDYESLNEVSTDDAVWDGAHSALVSANPDERTTVARILLDYLRRELAMRVDFLSQSFQEQLIQRSSQRLQGMWALDEDETLRYASIAVARPRRPNDPRVFEYVGPRGQFGRYLRRPGTFPSHPARLDEAETAQVVQDLFGVLALAGLVEVLESPDADREDRGYQIPAAALIWRAGDGATPAYDPLRMPRQSATPVGANEFFVDLYRSLASDAIGIEAREHTAQVPYDLREEREQRFREGSLPILFSSPTMELGVDIAELNVVGLRNVPPTPANYAQRSGRAGRSGSPALVFTYATAGSPHDQFFFRRPEQMASGAVKTPRLDLANEDLVRSHVNAIWLAESGIDLHRSLSELLDVDAGSDVPIRPWLADDLRRADPRERGRTIADRVLADLRPLLEESSWWMPEWVDSVLNAVGPEFDRSCARWRDLYRAAKSQYELQSAIVGDVSRSAQDKSAARRLRAEAEAQLHLLAAASDRINQSDFYSYRYFASEGFLPGYSFPRLPLAAYIPGGRHRRRDGSEFEGEYVQRPRFLAISEFGPRNFIYHEGARYEITKVILPLRAAEGEAPSVLTTEAKRCDACGYLHPLGPDAQPDVCERCGSALGPPWRKLFRLQNVATRRRDRIISDEEERRRQGFELFTAMRFARRQGQLSMRKADVEREGETIATLSYADTATLWRVNVGRRRRRRPDRYGFVLDVERGYWGSDEGGLDDPDAPPEPSSARSERVIPYVEDDRNCLLLEPRATLDTEAMASVQAALKHAVQVVYQLEDDELAAEPLPTPDRRRLLLFYESAEGGAGVLRRLVDEADQLALVARTALELCHVDPDTGTDIVGGSPAPCEAACYHCLLSYRNQPDHEYLDRRAAVPVLRELAAAKVAVSPGPVSRDEHVTHLERLTDSVLEQQWVEFVAGQDLRLPSATGVLIEEADTRVDFLYQDDMVAVFVDGPPHDYADRAQRDQQVSERLRNLGYTVIRFGHRDDWAQILDTYRWVFGEPE